MPNQNTPPNLASAKTLHIMLCAGVLVLQLVFAAMNYLSVAPFVVVNAYLGSIFAGIGIVVLATAFVMKKRIPTTPYRTAIESYWKTPGVIEAATLVWVMSQGAAVVSAIGYLMTAEKAPAIVSVVALVALVLASPERILLGKQR